MRCRPLWPAVTALTLNQELKDDAIIGSIIGSGKDAEIVKETMAAIEKLYTNSIENELDDMKDQMPKSMKPMITAYESLQFRTREKEGIITMRIPSVDPFEVIFGLYASFTVEAEDFEIEENAVEIVPAPVPVPTVP